MKLSNIFKKENKTVVKANVEKLEKNQLEKVIGGTGTAKEFTPAEEQLSSKPRH